MANRRRWIITDDSNTPRCWWCVGDPDYLRYHDREWGRPVADDARLFEKICLEGFQAGLSWLTILRKRDNFRGAFHGFDIESVAPMTKRDVNRLLRNEGIVRHRGKIESTINNANRALEAIDEFGSLSAYLWRFAPPINRLRVYRTGQTLLTQTTESTALTKDLRARGWSFVGPTTMYAFMQAVGMVNDHLARCAIHDEVRDAQRLFKRPR